MSRLSITLLPQDLTWDGWDRLLGPLFKTLILHESADGLRKWAGTDAARVLLARMAERGVEVEYIMHVAAEAVPRRLFAEQPDLFRMNEQWQRVPDANLCPSSPDVEGVMANYLKPYVEALRPTTGRYHFCPDDNRPWCFCRECRQMTWPDQNLLFANMLARIVRRWDGGARVSYLSYKPAIEAPVAVKPEKNVFLLFAPIERDYRHPLVEQHTARDAYYDRAAGELLAWFGRRDSTVLEYWLDVSMFSRWMEPRQEIPVPARVMRSDLTHYQSLGFEGISTFGAWIDQDYVRTFGDAAVRRFKAAWRAANR
jgi:hypothetical protein